MISNKAAVILFLITVNMKLVASTTPKDTPESSSSNNSTLTRKRKRGSKVRNTIPMLVDKDNTVNPVEAIEKGIETLSVSQEQSVPQVNKELEKLINQGQYKKLFEFVEEMGPDDFGKQLCPVVKTFEQYKGIVDYLRDHNMVARFYVSGNIKVVEVAIVESEIYGISEDLGNALILALKGDRHGRIIELLDIRKEMTAESDKRLARNGEVTEFGTFVYDFLYDLAPWEDGTAFKRFLASRGDELRNKHPYILDTLCQELLALLNSRLDDPTAEKLLVDLVGQPLLLTSTSFVKGFFGANQLSRLSNIIKYGWDGAIVEGLKKEHNDAEELWQTLKAVRPTQFPGNYPLTDDALVAIFKHFPTKRKLEERWGKENVPDFSERLEKLITDDIFPKVIMRIVIEYADPKPTWLEILSTKSS